MIDDEDPPQGTDTEILQIKSLDTVRAEIEEYKKLPRFSDGCNLIVAAELLKAAVLAGMPDPEVEYFIQHCTEQVIVGTKTQFAAFKKSAKIDALNRRKALARARNDYHAQLIQSSDGRAYVSNTHNIGILLENDDALLGLFSLDDFTNKVMITKRPVWMINGEWRDEYYDGGMEMNDRQLTHLTAYIQHLGLHHARDADVAKCLEAVAATNHHNSLTDWLSKLACDGVPRIGRWLTRYLRAEDNLYTRCAGGWWLMSAVARAFLPGCKADYVLLLEGRQGAKKSTFWQVVARKPKWYLEYTEDLNTADGRKQLRGKWLIVLPELAGLNRKEVKDVKAFITRQYENVRDLWQTYHKDVPRSSVLCGDTNEAEYFSDTTGNRRYWPIEVSDLGADLEALDAAMDQLWAEAVHWFRIQQKWWPDDYIDIEFNAMQKEETDKRMRTDPWYYTFREWLANYERAGHQVIKLPNATILAQMVLGLKPSDVDQTVATRIGTVMSRLRYHRSTVRLTEGATPSQGFKKEG